MGQFLIDTLSYYTFWVFLSGILLGGVLVYAAWHLWRWFHILCTSTTPIADLQEGQVEVKGRVKAKYGKLGKKSVYYKAIYERYQSGKNGGWRTESKHETLLPFDVKDNTGMIMIANQDASVDIAQDSITGRDVKEHGAERTRHFCLEDDSPVYVIGHLGRHKGERRIGKASGIPFIISNHTEADLLFKHGWGFGLVAVVVLAASILLGLAHSNWMETWEGRVVRKYTYRTKSKDSTTTHYAIKTTHYAIDFDTGAKRELRRSEWNSVRAGNYIVKNSHRYTIEIRR